VVTVPVLTGYILLSLFVRLQYIDCSFILAGCIIVLSEVEVKFCPHFYTSALLYTYESIAEMRTKKLWISDLNLWTVAINGGCGYAVRSNISLPIADIHLRKSFLQVVEL
jgi:hypothetical protein